MLFSFWKSTVLSMSTAGLISLAGCSEVSRHDVTAAREDAREEQQDVIDAQRDAREKIANQERETEEVRREAFRPNYNDTATDAIRAEERETDEIRREAEEAIREEQQEANEATLEAEKTEARFMAQKARDAYVSDAELQLVKFDEQIATMKEQSANLDGAPKVAHEEKLELIDTRRDAVREAIDDVKSAEATEWELARDDVERALKDLTQALTTVN